jgi:magnesium-transporting ATPase (P-type)
LLIYEENFIFVFLSVGNTVSTFFVRMQNPKNGGQLKLGGLAPSNLELALVKQYPFDSAVQRMTVVAKKKGTPAYSVFIKGAPEKVASLCRPNTSEAERFLFCVPP